MEEDADADADADGVGIIVVVAAAGGAEREVIVDCGCEVSFAFNVRFIRTIGSWVGSPKVFPLQQLAPSQQHHSLLLPSPIIHSSKKTGPFVSKSKELESELENISSERKR